jgi:hypothetical protein
MSDPFLKMISFNRFVGRTRRFINLLAIVDMIAAIHDKIKIRIMAFRRELRVTGFPSYPDIHDLNLPRLG